MSFEAGRKLAHYEILEPIGRGGMGEVYRARDGKLGRDVAIKALPEELAQDDERLRRFQREAKVLASLNHPNIASIYGLEESAGTHYLVLELVEGETLAEHIARGPIPVEETLAIAQKIAEALEEAHERGIVHRDLKPANIKLTPDDKVKVLDFGLAKAFAEEMPEGDSSMSPTITRDATRVGVILGTAAYMSPEQAKGKAVDKRTDIFSFGILLYEMLTGKRAFAGEDVSDVLAAILRAEPNWKALPPTLDPRLESLLRRCLRKDCKKRLQAIGDVRVEIEDILAEPTSANVVPEATRVGRGVPVAAALLFGGIVAVAVWMLKPEPEPPRRVVRVAVALPSAGPLDLSSSAPDVDVAITPDGTHVVYPVNVDGQRQLVVRGLDELEATPLVRGSGAGLAVDVPRGPFISPDGSWVGYFDEGGHVLRKVSILGGPPVTIFESPEPLGSSPRGASWGPDDTILFGTNAPSGLWRVPAGGGEPEELTHPDDERENHLWPEILPGGEAVLFTIVTASVESARIAVSSLSTGEVKLLVPGGSNPRYARTGHIVYGVDGALRAVGFDAARLAVTSDPVPVLDGVVTKSTGAANFALSRDGSLVYVEGSPQGRVRTLVWVDRNGKEEALAAEPRAYTLPRISPDGSQVALDVRDQENDLWVWDFKRESLRRLTFDADRDQYPTWTPDGRRLVFQSFRDGTGNLYWKAADGTGTIERLTEGENTQQPYGFSPDGKRLVHRERHPEGDDLNVLALEGGGRDDPLVAEKFNELNADLSSEGRWLAYQWDASGRYEIYVRPFPNVEADLRQISSGGGTRPLWARDGSELFYLDLGGRLVAVSVRRDVPFEFGNPEVVLERTYFFDTVGRPYDVSADGERFLVIKEDGGTSSASSPQLILVQNWLEELKRLLPTE